MNLHLPLLLLIFLTACTQQPAVSTATLPAPTALPVDTTAPATPTAPPIVEQLDEAIFILSPGPGSHVSNPIHVTGTADPTFEQNLVVRILLDDGSLLSETPTTIQAEAGQRGDFSVDIPIPLLEERNLFIQVYTTSARDGGITHLTSSAVVFRPDGPEEIRLHEDAVERIVIYEPTLNATVQGGFARVSGFALASFEQMLVVEVQDAAGQVVGTGPIMVQAPELGVPGPFLTEIAYSVDTAGPGRIVVRDPSPAFNGNNHLASVEVNLEP